MLQRPEFIWQEVYGLERDILYGPEVQWNFCGHLKGCIEAH